MGLSISAQLLPYALGGLHTVLTEDQAGSKVMAGIFSVTAAIYGTYWDLVMDRGLLQVKSKNWSLRDKLLIPYRSVYFGAMASIFPTYSNLKCNCCQPSGLWNFFGLENDHLYNVVKYRAFKPVQRPFDYNVG
ncbi:hypothetical protein POTOM_024683 [Populus tomentosa]|uniref:EXS domain-containing protein n=1 Tax=Populus tomentosa TaxID=118781 RepID=A0A8X7ZMS7_POPTO|nr:hypothetical protein POTOM_024683 [Populus tomentosa]